MPPLAPAGARFFSPFRTREAVESVGVSPAKRTRLNLRNMRYQPGKPGKGPGGPGEKGGSTFALTDVAYALSVPCRDFSRHRFLLRLPQASAECRRGTQRVRAPHTSVATHPTGLSRRFQRSLIRSPRLGAMAQVRFGNLFRQVRNGSATASTAQGLCTKPPRPSAGIRACPDCDSSRLLLRKPISASTEGIEAPISTTNGARFTPRS